MLASLLVALLAVGTPERVSPAQAEVLIENSTGHTVARSGVAELTSSDLWERAHAQIFQERETTASGATYLVVQGRVFSLGAVASYCVADVDADGVSEVLYTLHGNDGLVGAFMPAYGNSLLFGDRTFRGGAWQLDKIDEQQVNLITNDDSGRSITVASLGIRNGTVHLTLKPKLPRDIRRKLAR